MLTALLILYLRKLDKKHAFLRKIRGWNFSGFKVPLIILLLSFQASSTFAQQRSLKFGVWRNQACIGYINIDQKIMDKQTSYQLKSEINFRLLMSFQIVSSEKAMFENGILKSSSVFRKINGNEKANKGLQFNNGVYRLTNGNNSRIVSMDSVYLNLISLYFNQPNNIKKIYLDNHQTVSDVIKLEDGKYKVPLSDGAYNIFYYQNGICKKVESVNPLYQVQIIPMTKTP